MSAFMTPEPQRRRPPGIAWGGGLALAVMVALGVMVEVRQPADPVYEGRPLSDYLASYSEQGLGAGGVDENLRLLPPRIELQCDPAAPRAIRSLGVACLPRVVCMLAAKDTSLKRLVWHWNERSPWFRRTVRWNPRSGWSEQIGALGALRELGEVARPAVPGILPLLEDPACAHVAIAALVEIRPEHPPHFLALTNVLRLSGQVAAGADAQLLHASALLALSEWGPKAAAAEAVALEALSSTNGRVAGAAAIALARMEAAPEVVVPIVARRLSLLPAVTGLWPPFGRAGSFEEERVLLMNLFALREYGPRAAMARGALSNLLGTADARIRVAVTRVLAATSPDPSAAP